MVSVTVKPPEALNRAPMQLAAMYGTDRVIEILKIERKAELRNEWETYRNAFI